MIARDDEMGAKPPRDEDGPRLIIATPEEKRNGRYSTANIQSALEAMHQDGFAVLKSVVDVDHVRRIREFTDVEAEDLIRGNKKPFNQGVNSNILQGPPLNKPELLFNDVFFNPFVIQVMNAYLGSPPSWGFVTGNTALPNTHGMRQPVHKDMVFFHPQAPFYVIANMPLSSFNKENGSTEFWLGSHAHTSGHDQVIATAADQEQNPRLIVGEPMCFVRPEVVEERRSVRPPVQPAAEPGDFMLRDLRTWHAGMPNETDQFRTMLALGYKAPWFENHGLRAKLPARQANFFMKAGGQPVEVRADMLPDEADFGLLNDDFNFRHTSDLEDQYGAFGA
ncbi:phytanoyl-dioxygenase family protein [Xylariomycetidae sp. FL2044]|nr:phytanoyl-dioxygenase family protein [Xylariomycetidae sp. FL2044]